MEDDIKSEILRVRISKSDKDQLREYAQSQNIGMSQAVRNLINEKVGDTDGIQGLH